MNITEQQFIAPEHAGKILGVCSKTIRNYMAQGKLRGVWLTSNTLRVYAEDLQRMIDKGTHRPMPSKFTVTDDSELKFVENVADDCIAEVVMKDVHKQTASVAASVGNGANVVNRRLTDAEAASVWGKR